MIKLEEIRPGTVVSGPKWPEPVEVKKIENDGSYVHIVGATQIQPFRAMKNGAGSGC